MSAVRLGDLLQRSFGIPRGAGYRLEDFGTGRLTILGCTQFAQQARVLLPEIGLRVLGKHRHSINSVPRGDEGSDYRCPSGNPTISSWKRRGQRQQDYFRTAPGLPGLTFPVLKPRFPLR